MSKMTSYKKKEEKYRTITVLRQETKVMWTGGRPLRTIRIPQLPGEYRAVVG